MKKLILSVTAVAGFSMASFAQGVIYFDGSNNSSTSLAATSEGEVFISGVLDTSQDINVELLAGSSASTVTTPVVTLLLSVTQGSTSPATGQVLPAGSDITLYGSGVLYDNNGLGYQISGTSSGATEYFEVEGWLGNYSSLAAAQAAGQKVGTTAPFAEVLTSATGEANDIEGMPALNLTATAVPEPSTLAMAGVGLASMLIFRRKNK
jgi:hypothetical protein